MKEHKFTICYRHIYTGDIFCDHGEGRTEAEVAIKLIEARINKQRTDAYFKPLDMDKEADRALMNYHRSKHELLFAFRGHQKQLL